MDDLTPDEISAFIAANEWRFAKTMPKTPHFYVVKNQSTDPLMFERFARHIEKHGYPQKFWKMTFTYFDVGPHQYWVCADGPVLTDPTAILNRAERGIPAHKRPTYKSWRKV